MIAGRGGHGVAVSGRVKKKTGVAHRWGEVSASTAGAQSWRLRAGATFCKRCYCDVRSVTR